MARKIVSKSWNKTNAADQINKRDTDATYRSVNNPATTSADKRTPAVDPTKPSQKRGGSIFSCDSLRLNHPQQIVNGFDSSDYTRHKRINFAIVCITTTLFKL
jgi:hypothetical protein